MTNLLEEIPFTVEGWEHCSIYECRWLRTTSMSMIVTPIDGNEVTLQLLLSKKQSFGVMFGYSQRALT